MIQLAEISEIDQILNLTSACAYKMNEEGIYQWNDSYPNYKVFRQDIEREELYLFKLENKIVGCIVISRVMDDVYQTIQWLTKNRNNYYIHRLAVHPDYQGKGIARKLMDFAEDLAVQDNITSIRLDTFSKNPRNQKFYNARGYQKLGDIYFPMKSEFPFYCYELPLKNKVS